MPKLILTRHGQTDYNAQHRYQGHTDIPLNAMGVAQARLLAERLRKVHLDAVYCSDLQRASYTAELVLQVHPSGLQPTVTPLLREISGGSFEGRTWEENKALFPEVTTLWENENGWYTPPDGETLEQVLERLRQVINTIVHEYPGDDKTVLLVVHGGVIGLLVGYLIGLEPHRLRQLRADSCSLTIIDIYQKTAILSLFNDTNHLESLTA